MNKLALVQDAILHFLPDATISYGRPAWGTDYEIRITVAELSLLDWSAERFGEIERDRERLIQKDYD